MLSLTMRNVNPALPRSVLLPFHVKGDAQLLFHVPFNFLRSEKLPAQFQ